MHCKLCNTRIGENVRFCPNCGNDVGVLVRREVRPKAGRMTRLPVRPRKSDAELELADPADPNDLSGPDLSGGEQSEPVRTLSRAARGGASIQPDPAAVRETLSGRPELLEPGLRTHTDAQGKPAGVDFSTDVGDIDLLARDAAGSFVVVMVAERGQAEECVPELLQRIGWVRKHLATGGEKVRGTLVLDQAPESLGYAAAAVADTITFKTYRMSLSFEELRM